MRNLLRCRRGAAALTTVIALVPLIGAVGLGAEAGSWYVTKQRAQNAADAAAYSGALRLACSLGAVSCADTQSVDYRGKELAAQNAFCNAGDTTAYPNSQCATSLPTGTSQAVQINTLTAWNGVNGNFVQATVGQQEPTVLARLVGLPSVNIRAQATARITGPKQVCALGLGRYSGSGSPTSAVVFAGSEALSGSGCAFQSDNTVKFASAPSFTGTGWAVYAVKGCINSGTCNPGVPYNYYMPPATNPLAKLDTESFNTASGSNNPCGLKGGPNANIGNGQSCTIASNTPTTAYGGNFSVTNGGAATFTAGGTYFFKDANISIAGAGTTVTGSSVNIVLLGNSTLSITGGTVNLSANFNNTKYPDLNGVLFDDQAPNKSNLAVTINGGGGTTIALGGALYFPNVDVSMTGTSKNKDTACTEVISNSLNFGGGAGYFNAAACPPSIVPSDQIVTLVQ